MKTFLAAGVAVVSMTLAGGNTAFADARDDARVIGEILSGEEVLDAAFSGMSELFMQSIRGSFASAGIGLSNETADVFGDIMLDELKQVLGSELVDLQAELFLLNFSSDELVDIRAFLESESGQAFARRQGVLMQEAGVRGEQIVAAQMPAIMANVRSRLEGAEGSRIPRAERDQLLSIF